MAPVFVLEIPQYTLNVKLGSNLLDCNIFGKC
jgi:hypothetical protein